MNKQLSHQTNRFKSKTFPIVLVCDGVQSPSNIGGLFRICDALGVSQIIFCNADVNINSSRLKKTARNSEKNVSYTISNNLLSEIDILKQQQYHILALEITEKSKSIEKLKLSKDQKIALIIGNEQHGISEKALQKVQEATHINMYGKNSSMNVVQATAIALYSILNKSYIY